MESKRKKQTQGGITNFFKPSKETISTHASDNLTHSSETSMYTHNSSDNSDHTSDSSISTHVNDNSNYTGEKSTSTRTSDTSVHTSEAYMITHTNDNPVITSAASRGIYSANPYQPDASFPFPQTIFGKQNRSCQADWFKKYTWLDYNVKYDTSRVLSVNVKS